jgi:hypothetical protein
MSVKHSFFCLAMAFSLSSIFAATPEEKFWRWFEKNEDRIFAFEADQERVFDEVASQMRVVNSSLTFEFGPVRDGRREFVISADGDKKAFPAVQSLYSCAPSLAKWIFVKFRPRRQAMDLAYKGLKITAASVKVLIAKDPKPGKLGLIVLFPGFEIERERDYKFAAFLILDGALGEFDVEMRVGYVGVGSLDHPEVNQAFSLADLPAAFDRCLAANAEKG